MDNSLALFTNKEKIKTLIFDIVCVGVMFFVPAFSHMSKLPLYLLEPLRIMIILSLVHTRKENAYIMAVALPVFSYLVSGHPFFGKMIVICFEMLLNIGLFFMLSKFIKNSFISMGLSIIISKGFYYFCQYVFLRELVEIYNIGEHPLYIQGLLSIGLSVYVYFIFNIQKKISNGGK